LEVIFFNVSALRGRIALPGGPQMGKSQNAEKCENLLLHLPSSLETHFPLRI
jgi:hypothetical protein